MAKEVMEVMQDLYFDGPGARALLIRIGYRPAQIPEFRAAETFWSEVVLRLERGIVEDGIPRLLAETARDHPGNRSVRELLNRSNSTSDSHENHKNNQTGEKCK